MKDKTPWGFEHKSSGGTTFKFPKRMTTVRFVEVARDISHLRFGDRDFEMSSSLDNENPEIAICDFAI